MPYMGGLGDEQGAQRFYSQAGGLDYPWQPSLTASTVPTGTATGTQQNIAALPDLTSLTNEINALNRAAQSQALAARIPQASALEAKSSANIAAELAGNVPSDVMNLLGQQAAERGVARGIAGSQNLNAAYLRALGLTSLGQQAKGQQDLTAALARNVQAPLFDVTSQLITPYQQAMLDFQKQQLAQQAELRLQEMENQRYLAALSASRYGGGGGYGPSASRTPTPIPVPPDQWPPFVPPPSGGDGRGGDTFANDPNMFYDENTGGYYDLTTGAFYDPYNIWTGGGGSNVASTYPFTEWPLWETGGGGDIWSQFADIYGEG